MACKRPDVMTCPAHLRATCAALISDFRRSFGWRLAPGRLGRAVGRHLASHPAAATAIGFARPVAKLWLPARTVFHHAALLAHKEQRSAHHGGAPAALRHRRILCVHIGAAKPAVAHL